MLIDQTIGFLGAGVMSEAIISGLLEQKTVPNHGIAIANRWNTSRIQMLVDEYKLSIDQCQFEHVTKANVVILAVKPKDMLAVLEKWGSHFQKGQLIISVAAGIPVAFIEKFLDQQVAVIRAMPNTSASVGLSMTAITAGAFACEDDLQKAQQIFSAIGSVIQVKEELMDAVTGLSGSGPAFFYYMVEAMESAGIKAGFTESEARSLTRQTILGAAHMLLATDQSAGQLRENVTSPNGTTLAGLKVLHHHQFTEAVEQAVLAAKDRSTEMGKELAEKLLNA